MGSWLHLVLGVKPDAASTEIRTAYTGLLKRYHPDLCPETPANRSRLELIRMAYQVLNDPDLRLLHTRTGEIPQRVDIPPNLQGKLNEASLRNLAKGFLDGFKKTRLKRGRDLVNKVHLSVRELLEGTTRIFDIERDEKCPECSGSGSGKDPAPVHCHVCDGVGTIGWRKVRSVGIECPFCEGVGVVIAVPCTTCVGRGTMRTKSPFRVTFPPGTPEGHRTVVNGEGQRGQDGGRHGDLVFIARLDPESGFERVGRDLIAQAPVDGQSTRISIDHPDGPVELTVPNEGSVTTVVVKGYGLPIFGDSSERGDLKVHLQPAAPSSD